MTPFILLSLTVVRDPIFVTFTVIARGTSVYVVWRYRDWVSGDLERTYGVVGMIGVVGRNAAVVVQSWATVSAAVSVRASWLHGGIEAAPYTAVALRRRGREGDRHSMPGVVP